MAEEKPEVHPDFNKKSSTGMEPKVAVLISHIGFLVGAGWLSGLIVYMLEKENKLVKFQAMQSLIIGIGEIAIWIVGLILFFITILIGGVCGWVLWIVGLIGLFVIRIIIVVKIFNGENYSFPWIGKMSEKWMSKFK
jgi:uncharacterized membrane protein